MLSKCSHLQPPQRRESLHARFSHADFPDAFSHSIFLRKAFLNVRVNMGKAFLKIF
jgi:hypothetical protein